MQIIASRWTIYSQDLLRVLLFFISFKKPIAQAGAWPRRRRVESNQAGRSGRRRGRPSRGRWPAWVTRRLQLASLISSHLISSRPRRCRAPLRRPLSSLSPSRRPTRCFQRQPGRRPTRPPPLALPLLEPCKMLPVLVTNKPVTLRPLQLRSRP